MPLQDRLLRVVITVIGVDYADGVIHRFHRLRRFTFLSESRFTFSRNTDRAKFEEFESA